MSDRLVTIATFGSVAQANIAGLRLKTEGIRFFITDGIIAEAHYGPMAAFAKLQVIEDDAERALSALQADNAPQISEEEWRAGGGDEDFEPEVDGG